MKRSQLKSIIKNILREVTSTETPKNNNQIHIQGYGMASAETIIKTIGEDLKKANDFYNQKDWKNLNTVLGRTGNGVLPEVISTIKNNLTSDGLNEDHGDVHYWGTQNKDKNSKISTGYNSTVKMNEGNHPLSKYMDGDSDYEEPVSKSSGKEGINVYDTLKKESTFSASAGNIRNHHSISKPVKDSNTGEYVVKWMTNGKRDENKTYYTDDYQDAMDTYTAMSQEASTLNNQTPGIGTGAKAA